MAQNVESGCSFCCCTCNCCVAVPQDKFFAVEKCGKFDGILEPGLNIAGCDICGTCISFRSITSRVDQNIVNVATKTKDNVFVVAKVAIQSSVIPQQVLKAMYSLSNVYVQIDSYVADVVRSTVPLMLLDEAFEKKDDISDAVQSKLTHEMAEFGFQIHKALVTELMPNAEVMHSMNEINKQKRLRDAAVMAAEAQKVQVVKAAEAAADAAQLQGEGIARQRRAIIDGLRDSITAGTSETLSSERISELLLITQYFETLRDIAASGKAQTVFTNNGSNSFGDIGSQIRNGILQAAPFQHKM